MLGTQNRSKSNRTGPIFIGGRFKPMNINRSNYIHQFRVPTDILTPTNEPLFHVVFSVKNKIQQQLCEKHTVYIVLFLSCTTCRHSQ
jgi:hypothetical protein